MVKETRGGRRGGLSTEGLAKIPEGQREKMVAYYKQIYDKVKKQFGQNSGGSKTIGMQSEEKKYIKQAEKDYKLAKKGFYSWGE